MEQDAFQASAPIPTLPVSMDVDSKSAFTVTKQPFVLSESKESPQPSQQQQPAWTTATTTNYIPQAPYALVNRYSIQVECLAPRHFCVRHSAVLYLTMISLKRSGRVLVPKACRWPTSKRGSGGYADAYRALGFHLYEEDTSGGHWHAWFFPKDKIHEFPQLQLAILARMQTLMV